MDGSKVKTVCMKHPSMLKATSGDVGRPILTPRGQIVRPSTQQAAEVDIRRSAELEPTTDLTLGREKFGVRLSGREVEILRLIASGNRTKEVANILFVSKRTIDYHLANAYLKLGVSNRIQAILAASGMGLIPTGSEFAVDRNMRQERGGISRCPEQHLISYENVENYGRQERGRK